jgi:aminoglycoside phosphotransferase (APT) family kinase protein
LSDKDLAKFALLAEKVRPGSRLVRAWALTGGVSAQVTAMELALPDGRRTKLVVRRQGAVDRERNPRIAEDEFRLLALLRDAGVPVPAPHYVDGAGEVLGSPCVVMEFVEGQAGPDSSDLPQAIPQMASQLSRIHNVTPAHADLRFLPKQEGLDREKLGERPDKLDESIGEGRIRDALERVWPLPNKNGDVLLHGDYWPGNTLWKDGRLVAIIDWEDASVGDPLEDVANSRLEMLWAYGVEAMQDFTEQYMRAVRGIDFATLPFWDLCAALRPAFKIAAWAGNDEREAIMRERHRWFVEKALEGDMHFR